MEARALSVSVLNPIVAFFNCNRMFKNPPDKPPKPFVTETNKLVFIYAC